MILRFRAKLGSDFWVRTVLNTDYHAPLPAIGVGMKLRTRDREPVVLRVLDVQMELLRGRADGTGAMTDVDIILEDLPETPAFIDLLEKLDFKRVEPV